MEIVTALTALHTGFGLAKVAMEARDEAKLRSAMNDLGIKLSDALSTGLQIHAKALELQHENEQLRKKLVDFEGYQLVAVGDRLFAYEHKAPQGDTTPHHYICQACMDQGKKSVLQRSLNGTHLLCKVDSTHSLQIGNPGEMQPIRRSSWNPL